MAKSRKNASVATVNSNEHKGAELTTEIIKIPASQFVGTIADFQGYDDETEEKDGLQRDTDPTRPAKVTSALARNGWFTPGTDTGRSKRKLSSVLEKLDSIRDVGQLTPVVVERIPDAKGGEPCYRMVEGRNRLAAVYLMMKGIAAEMNARYGGDTSDSEADDNGKKAAKGSIHVHCKANPNAAITAVVIEPGTDSAALLARIANQQNEKGDANDHVVQLCELLASGKTQAEAAAMLKTVQARVSEAKTIANALGKPFIRRCAGIPRTGMMAMAKTVNDAKDALARKHEPSAKGKAALKLIEDTLAQHVPGDKGYYPPKAAFGTTGDTGYGTGAAPAPAKHWSEKTTLAEVYATDDTIKALKKMKVPQPAEYANHTLWADALTAWSKGK